jgi:hypothetical protein
MKKLLLLSISIAFLAAACQPTNPPPTPTPTPPPPASQNDTSNWKTYSNATWGFSLKYPSEYRVGSTNNMKKEEVLGNVVVMQIGDPKDKSIEFGPSLNVTVTKQPYDVTGKLYTNVNDFVNLALEMPGTITKEQIKVDGYDAVKISYTQSEVPVMESTSIWIIKDKWLYTITYSPTGYKNFADIAASFKFTSESTSVSKFEARKENGKMVLYQLKNGTWTKTGLLVTLVKAGTYEVPVNIVVSADGTKVAYNVWKGVFMEIYVADINGSNAKKIAQQKVSEGQGELNQESLSWSADGKFGTFTESQPSCPVNMQSLDDCVRVLVTYQANVVTGSKTEILRK